MDNIATKRMILRKWKLTDYKDLYEYAKSDLVGPNAGWAPHKDEAESKEIISMFIEADDVLAIELKSEKKVIGGIGLHRRKPDDNNQSGDQREIGYVLNPEYWGRGYIPEAVNSLIKYGFTNLKLDLIWCGHFDDNIKSRRVVEKCGFDFKFKKSEIKPLLNDKKVSIFYYSLSEIKDHCGNRIGDLQ